ncbi:MAG: RNA 2'-phosphotransferase [Planctomycetes bacterium]|nr:RNA 2'-phosphotransferase [Planctomycetota bacterium]
MIPEERERLSRTLTYILRHQPGEFGLELDEEGFVPVDALLAALADRVRWARPTVEHLDEVIRLSDKKRFEIREGRMRALYGHSVPVRIRYEPQEPPEILWHGTSRRAISAIRHGGLNPMGRQFVHLSLDEAAARTVGLRHDPRPVILRVRAGDAWRAGTRFFRGGDLVWLAESVPSDFIEG